MDQKTEYTTDHNSDVLPEKSDMVAVAAAPGLQTENPTLKQYYEDFAARGPEWFKKYETKLVRRIDIRLLPILVIMYLNNFLDRSALAQARIGSLEEDLGMTGSDFNTATAILFAGYISMQLPSNLLLTRLRPSWYLSIVMGIWGVICGLTAVVQNFAGLLVIRTFLGIMEAPFFPGAVYLMSCWYSRSELTKRIAWFYSGVSLANSVGGLIGAGVIGNLDMALGIADWRWLFIISGVTTVACAIVCFLVLPDFPSTTKWLSDEERAFCQYRMALDAVEDDDNESTSLWEGLKYAGRDYRLYLFMLLQHLVTLAGTFQYFFPSIIQTLEFGRIETLLITAPIWALAFIGSLVTTWTAAKTGDRAWHIIGLMAISCIGNIIVVSTTNIGARFFGMFLMPLGAVPAFTIVVAWLANSFIRPNVKRSAAIAICNSIGNSASIYGAYMYPSSSGPQYVPGGSAVAAICAATALTALVLRFVHIKENKKLEAIENDSSIVVADGERRGAGFRYVY